MATKKFFERLLIVVGMFFTFFVITMISMPLLVKILHIDSSTRNGLLFTSVYQSVVMFIAPAAISARIITRRPAANLSLNVPPSWLSIAGVVFAYLIALPFLNQIIYWNANISFPDKFAYFGEVMRELEDNAALASKVMLNVDSAGGLIVNVLIIGLLTAFGEELFFRGSLQNNAASSGAPHTAIWIVALFFSAMHFQVFGFVPRLLLGAWFGYLLLWTKSIYVPVAAHFINNSVVVVCSWLAARGVTFDFDMLGVTQYGFPLPAFVSAVSFVIFIVFFKNFFFRPSQTGNRELNSLNYG